MISLKEVSDWLKTLGLPFDHYYIGFLDSKKPKSIGTYQLKEKHTPNIAIGGMATTKTSQKGISLLVHWDKSSVETEKAALRLYELLQTVRNITINNHKINYISLVNNEPVDIGMDESGVFERVIELILYFERR